MTARLAAVEHVLGLLTTQPGLIQDDMTEEAAAPLTDAERAQREQQLFLLFDTHIDQFFSQFGRQLPSSILEQLAADPNVMKQSDAATWIRLFMSLQRRRRQALERPPATSIRPQTLKNRRFNYLNRVLLQSDYFSDQQMFQRAPSLYNQYLGPMEPAAFPNDMNLSERILQNYDFSEAERKLESERRHVETDVPEPHLDRIAPSIPEADPRLSKRRAIISVDQSAKSEFLELMKTRFVDGLDDFPYHSVDSNEELDDCLVSVQDAEEAYFEADENGD